MHRRALADVTTLAVKRAQHWIALLQNLAEASDQSLEELLCDARQKKQDWADIEVKIVEELMRRKISGETRRPDGGK